LLDKDDLDRRLLWKGLDTTGDGVLQLVLSQVASSS
jgi:hypothetical protein